MLKASTYRCAPSATCNFHTQKRHEQRGIAPCRQLDRLCVRTHGRRHRRRGPPPGCTACVSPEALFTVATVAVMPIYTMVIGFPHQQQTLRLLRSRLAMLTASLVYAAAFVGWLVSGRLQQLALVTHHVFAQQRVAWFASLAESRELTCLAWLHLLMLDLFQARYLFMDGLRRRIPTRHSLVLCFMFGPIGLLSHMITDQLVSWRRSRAPQTQLG